MLNKNRRINMKSFLSLLTVTMVLLIGCSSKPPGPLTGLNIKSLNLTGQYATQTTVALITVLKDFGASFNSNETGCIFEGNITIIEIGGLPELRRLLKVEIMTLRPTKLRIGRFSKSYTLVSADISLGEPTNTELAKLGEPIVEYLTYCLHN